MPEGFLIYCNLHEEAEVSVHKSCYNQLCRELDSFSNVSTGTGNVSTGNVSTGSHREPLADITNTQSSNRAKEIACAEFILAKRTQSLPISSNSSKSTPIKVQPKRGKPITVQQLPSTESNYTQSSTPSIRSRVDAINATLTHLAHNPHSSAEENADNRVALSGFHPF